MISQRKYNYIDLTTFFIVLILMAISVLVVYTASSSLALRWYQDSEYFLNQHIIRIIAALIMMLVGIFIDYKKYQKHTKLALILGIILLIVTLITDQEIKKTNRFLSFLFITFQPSEFVKFLLIAHIAKLLAEKSFNVRDFKFGYLPLVIWILIVVGLVMLQPNYSMGLMILLTCFILIYLGGVRIKHLLVSFLSVVPFVFAYLLMAKYRTNRIMLYIENFERMIKVNVAEIIETIEKGVRDGVNATNALGQIWQGIIAFGNGGIFGVGLGNSRQRDFYIPEAYNDFIFSIIGEEYGLIGTIAILTLFIIIFLRGLKIANYARDDFGRYLALGITIVIIFYAMVNASVTLGIVPATGLPMPFVSYGGSSFVATSFAVGVMLNISKQTDLNPRISKIPVVGTVNAKGEI